MEGMDLSLDYAVDDKLQRKGQDACRHLKIRT